MQFMHWLTIGLGALQTANAIIPLVERPGSGPEKQKLVIEATRAIVGTAVAASGNPPLSPEDNAALDFLTAAVTSSLVTFLNTLGVFQQVPAKPVEVEVVGSVARGLVSRSGPSKLGVALSK